jgi:hypothetical protein
MKNYDDEEAPEISQPVVTEISQAAQEVSQDAPTIWVRWSEGSVEQQKMEVHFDASDTFARAFSAEPQLDPCLDRIDLEGVSGAFIIRGALSLTESQALSQWAQEQHHDRERVVQAETPDTHAVKANESSKNKFDNSDRSSDAAADVAVAEPVGQMYPRDEGRARRGEAPRRDSQHHVPVKLTAPSLAVLSRRIRPWLPSHAGPNDFSPLEAPDCELSTFLRCYW